MQSCQLGFFLEERKILLVFALMNTLKSLFRVCRAQALGGDNLVPLLLLIPFLSFSFFQGHNSLECRITQIQVDL